MLQLIFFQLKNYYYDIIILLVLIILRYRKVA